MKNNKFLHLPVLACVLLILTQSLYAQAPSLPTGIQSMNPAANEAFRLSVNNSGKKSSPSVKALEQAGYAIVRLGEQPYIGCLVVVNNQVNIEKMQEKGIVVNSQLDKYWTCMLPVNDMHSIFEIAGVEQVEIHKKAKSTLDKVKELTSVNKVHDGIDLTRSYKGGGVVIGIVDDGFNYSHPFFLSKTGSTCRISRVWEQSGIGAPPEGFAYGRELKGPEITMAEADYINLSHGTQVAGIAAGGYREDGTMLGIAPAAELVFVSNSGSMDGVIDGVKYIMDYAESIGKPVVVNLSLGFGYGAFDGTEPLPSALESLTGPGKIIVKSAGNDGDSPIHLSAKLSADSNSLKSYIQNNQNLPPYNTGSFEIISCSSDSSDFSVRLSIVNINGITEDSSILIQSAGPDQNLSLVDNDPTNPDTVKIESYSMIWKGMPTIQLFIDNPAQDDTGTYVAITHESAGSHVHSWIYDGRFTGMGNPYPFADGDSRHSISFPGQGKKIVTVGAYASKIEFKTIENTTATSNRATLRDIIPSSSVGPSFDGSLKPDISAPGMFISTSTSRFDNNYLPGGANWIYNTDAVNYNNEWYFYTMAEGTSAAAPVVSGIVALLLEANPNLQPEDVINILHNTAFRDEYTGNDQNIRWGHGKVNALDAMKSARANLVQPIIQGVDMIIYPNPANEYINVSFGDMTMERIEIIDLTGRCLKRVTNQNYIGVSGIKPGIYLLGTMVDGKRMNQQVLIGY